MPELGRWNGMDQLSEMYLGTSPYAYVLNNPVMFIDPDGRCVNRPEGEPCPDSPGGANNPINIQEVVILNPKSKTKAFAETPFPNGDLLDWNWGLGSGSVGPGSGSSGGSSGGGLGGGLNIASGYTTPDISVSNRPTFRPKFRHDGYDDAMKLIAGIEGAVSTVAGAKFALHNEVLRFNQNAAYKLSSPLTTMKNGASYWNNKFVKAVRTNHLAPLKTLSSKAPGGILVAADIALSGELKPSHAINVAMIGASFTGVGTVLAGVWFVADYGTGFYNYLNGDGFYTISDSIDEKYGTYHMYNGIY